jgi:hypothetical protein
VAHACNLSFSGGRNQEDQGLKPAQENSLQDPISKKKKTHKIGLVGWFKLKALSSSPSTTKKKKRIVKTVAEPVFSEFSGSQDCHFQQKNNCFRSL